MSCRRRNGKQRGECVCFYGLSIRQKLKIPQPSISAISMPAATERLRIKNHLADNTSILTCILFKCNMTIKIIWYTNMTCDDHDHIVGRVNQVLPNRLSVITILDRIIFFFYSRILAVHIRMRSEDHTYEL